MASRAAYCRTYSYRCVMHAFVGKIYYTKFRTHHLQYLVLFLGCYREAQGVRQTMELVDHDVAMLVLVYLTRRIDVRMNRQQTNNNDEEANRPRSDSPWTTHTNLLQGTRHRTNCVFIQPVAVNSTRLSLATVPTVISTPPQVLRFVQYFVIYTGSVS